MRGHKPREQQRPSAEKHLLNEQINSAEVRLIGDRGEQLGVLTRADALARAEAEGVDLVLVAPDAKPPVCKLLDYGKLKYREQKKAAEARKKSATASVKELRIRYNTEQHDLDTKVRKARKFLLEGDKVRFQMRFRGREVVYQSLGRDTLDKIIKLLEDVAVVEDYTPLMGNRMIVSLTPRSGAKPVS